jgi:hypothetical protein
MKKINLKHLIFSIFLLTAIGCGMKKFTSDQFSQTTADPLFKYAWHLLNVGQSVFATTPAKVGFDLNLTNTWNQQIYGNGILVQVSDDGLEDTHEDLKVNFSYLATSKNYMLTTPFTATTSPPRPQMTITARP